MTCIGCTCFGTCWCCAPTLTHGAYVLLHEALSFCHSPLLLHRQSTGITPSTSAFQPPGPPMTCLKEPVPPATSCHTWQGSQQKGCCWLQVPVVSPHTDTFILRDVMHLQQTAPAAAPLQHAAAASLRLQLHADPSAPDRLYAVDAHGAHLHCRYLAHHLLCLHQSSLRHLSSRQKRLRHFA